MMDRERLAHLAKTLAEEALSHRDQLDALRTRIADLEAERDAARAGEARAVEALEAAHEAAALMRERRSDDAFWGVEYHRDYRRWQLTVGEFLSGGSAWRWGARYKGSQVCTASNVAPSHAAAQAAAMAWVDQQEGK